MKKAGKLLQDLVKFISSFKLVCGCGCQDHIKHKCHNECEGCKCSGKCKK